MSYVCAIFSQHVLTATCQNMARQAAVRFGQPSALNGTEGAGISHEMITGSPSVVVSTTSSHVHPEGTENDPQDMELLTKPRGFFADQFEVRSRVRQVSVLWFSLGRRCRTEVTLMHTTKGPVQRYGDKQTGNWTRSSRARVSRPSWSTYPSRRTERARIQGRAERSLARVAISSRWTRTSRSSWPIPREARSEERRVGKECSS